MVKLLTNYDTIKVKVISPFYLVVNTIRSSSYFELRLMIFLELVSSSLVISR